MSIGSLIALYLAGLATFLTPCTLPMLPVYLGILAGASADGTSGGASRRVPLAGIGFAAGLSAVFVLAGMGMTFLTRFLSGFAAWFELILGTLMMLFGGRLLGWLRLPWLDREGRPLLHQVPNVGGFAGGLLLGLGFAIGWTPCVGPALGATLTHAATAAANPLVAGGMLVLFALGLATPLGIGAFAASRLLVLTARLRKYSASLQRVTGALVLAFGATLALSSLDKLSYTSDEGAGCNDAKACDNKASKAGPEAPLGELPRGPALVEFVSEHCMACKKMRPVVSELERSCARGLIVRINVDEPVGERLAAHYGINQVPTFVRVDPSGSEIERIVGEQSRQRLILALDEAHGRPCGIGN